MSYDKDKQLFQWVEVCMSDKWYYVQKNNRHGPVELEVLAGLVQKQELRPEDHVWKKGFDNWKKIKEVNELNDFLNVPEDPEIPPMAAAAPATAVAKKAEPESEEKLGLNDLDAEQRSIFIRIGNDRGGAPSDYGPFNLSQLKQLFNERRINGKTFIFSPGAMKEWTVLGDLSDYQEVFQEQPPVIQEADRRSSVRKPFVARLFVQNNKKVFEGICRDISVGGLQVLVHDFQGAAGDRISINVHPENSEYHFVAAGQVVRLLEGNSGFSFRFVGLSDEARRAIEKYLQEN
jgi:hypothetical protein